MLTIHVVSHTHWDREWYHPAERFRQRLVALIDDLLDEKGAEGGFLLDGQTVVLEDYLEVRPERAADLSAALRAGTLEAGPWYVLADELIPSGEGLVRNLLAGSRALRAMRADAPAVLYCPDSFGHPAMLPELAAGFGKSLVILWRGFGGNRDTYWWTAPSRARVLLHHLTRSGYELGANLPSGVDAARERWRRIRDEIGARPVTGVALLLNGADHHAAQRDRAAAIRTLAAVAAPESVRPSSLADFSADIGKRTADCSLSEVKGELRDSYGYTWTLQGTLASRTPQKRQYALVERMLVRDVEPWVALAGSATRRSRRHLMNAAWKPLLLCQPHDTLCGCSIDAVARAMDQRLESAAVQGGGLREDAILDLLGHDRDAARVASDRWDPRLIVRNPVPRTRSGVALIEVTVKGHDVPVGPGSSPQKAERGQTLALPFPSEHGQVLGIYGDYDRVEAPRAYPDNDAVGRFLLATWISDAPPYGLSTIATTAFTAATPVPHPVSAKGKSLTNGVVTLRWDAKGRIALTDHVEKRTLNGLLAAESRVDRGDLYTPSIRGKKLVPKHIKTQIIHDGPMRGVVQQTWRLGSTGEHVDLTIQLILDAGTRAVRVLVLGDNQAVDHRLRLFIRTDVADGETWADAAFGAVERRPITAKTAAIETPPSTAPLHRYVSVFDAKRGATLFADGLTEYEASKNWIAVTLLRSVGELSRNDLPERPGHAGWPSATPEAQNIGPFDAELALMLHGPRTDATVAAIEEASDDFLHPITGETLRSAMNPPAVVQGIALEGTGIALNCIKESEDGEWLVLRCTNLLEAPVAGAWRCGRRVAEAKLARLDETPVTPLSATGDAIAFQAPPRGVVTVLVRF